MSTTTTEVVTIGHTERDLNPRTANVASFGMARAANDIRALAPRTRKVLEGLDSLINTRDMLPEVVDACKAWRKRLTECTIGNLEAVAKEIGNEMDAMARPLAERAVAPMKAAMAAQEVGPVQEATA